MDQFVATTRERIGIVRDKNVVIIHLRRPWELISNRLLSFWDMLRFGFNQSRLFSFTSMSVMNDITAWASYDNQSANDWVTHSFGNAVAYEITSTILNGFYFQSMATSDKLYSVPCGYDNEALPK